MVEISYGEYSEQADLAGNSVAEVREQYKPVFEIPDKAQAKLNGKGIKSKQEPERTLNDDDKLSFQEKSRRGFILIGALLAALLATGGMYAFSYTTATLGLGVTSKAEFATVTAMTAPTWTTGWMRYKGAVPTGDLFKVDPEDTYTGDLVVKVYLTNAKDLVTGYHYLNMKLQLRDGAHGTSPTNKTDWQDEGDHDYELLTLDNGVVTFVMKDHDGNPWYIWLTDGTYHTHPWKAAVGTTYLSPQLYCEVTQAGL